MLDITEFIRSFLQKMLMKNPRYIAHSLYIHETHLNDPKMLNILEFVWCSYK